jgi:hypothetical protein
MRVSGRPRGAASALAGAISDSLRFSRRLAPREKGKLWSVLV